MFFCDFDLDTYEKMVKLVIVETLPYIYRDYSYRIKSFKNNVLAVVGFIPSYYTESRIEWLNHQTPYTYYKQIYIELYINYLPGFQIPYRTTSDNYPHSTCLSCHHSDYLREIIRRSNNFTIKKYSYVNDYLSTVKKPVITDEIKPLPTKRMVVDDDDVFA